MELKKYTVFGQIIETNLNFDNVLPSSVAESNVFLIEKTIEENTKKPTRVWRKGTQAKYHKINNHHVLVWPEIAKFKIFGDNTIWFENLGCDLDTLKLFALSEAFGILLWQKGIFLLHGSAVEIDGNAYVFAGVPGAGKSTMATAFLQQKRVILTDDLVAIQIIENKPYVIPAFPQLKVWLKSLQGLSIDYLNLKPSFDGIEKYLISQPFEKFPKKNIPLKRITLLQKPKSNKEYGNISPQMAPIELIKHFPLPSRILINHDLKKHFLDSLIIAENAEIVFQKRPKNFSLLREFVNSYEK